MRTKTLESSLVEHLLELRMRHRDDEFGPLLQLASIEVHCAIFGHKPMDVVARGDCT